jgi:hypothetical protein
VGSTAGASSRVAVTGEGSPDDAPPRAYNRYVAHSRTIAESVNVIRDTFKNHT